MSTNPNDNDEDIQRQSILSNPELEKALRSFLTKEYSQENLLFLEDLQALDEKNWRKLGAETEDNAYQNVFEKYIPKGAPQQINLPAHIKNQIELNMKLEKKDNIFDNAKRSITHLLLSDPWPRFIQSKEYSEFEEKAKEQARGSAIEPKAPSKWSILSSFHKEKPLKQKVAASSSSTEVQKPRQPKPGG